MKPFKDAPELRHRPFLKRLLSFLRPRATWRYILCSTAFLYIAYCFVFSLPMFAHPLPKYTGPEEVGTIDIEVPLSTPRVVDSARWRGTDRSAFELQTVLFTLYYPAARLSSKKPGHYWIPKPISATAEGYAKFARINNIFTNTIFTSAVGALVGSIKIPAQVDIPLSRSFSYPPEPSLEAYSEASDKDIPDAPRSGYPVIVFSHGMASSRTDYTHYAGELASRGYVVAMIEHRDGSCPGSVIMRRGSLNHVRLHFKMDEVEQVNGQDLEFDDFKRAQLNFRQAEIEETVRVIQRINEGHGAQVYKSNSRNEGMDLRDWEGRLDTGNMIMAGHSYGATGALQALKGGPSKQRPFQGAIILDPGKSSGHLNDDIHVPIVVVHSNSWSASTSVFYGRPHFDTVKDLVASNNDRGNPSWLFTSLGTSHPSVTDAPLLEPILLSWTTGASIDVREGLRQYVHVSNDFIRFLSTGVKWNLFAEKAEFPQYDEGHGFGLWKPGQRQGQNDEKNQEREWFDWRKYWQVHVSPNQA